MNKIKFSHEYSKMPFRIGDMDRTILMEVFLENTKSLHETFVNYDTHIEGRNPLARDAYYKLLSGKVIILLLKSYHRIGQGLSESSGVWTTIRRWTPEKENYYKSKRGQAFKIEVITDEN